ncbi:hypothetical protein BKA62DRAFT_34750 [Auriculariales sp. MPI-PUGE-AT-0066]|nr:hypothetical protein BKA62DRAFT_34750 [Auriculariales sp. MPI-PUGE-AT-0066]
MPHMFNALSSKKRTLEQSQLSTTDDAQLPEHKRARVDSAPLQAKSPPTLPNSAGSSSMQPAGIQTSVYSRTPDAMDRIADLAHAPSTASISTGGNQPGGTTATTTTSSSYPVNTSTKSLGKPALQPGGGTSRDPIHVHDEDNERARITNLSTAQISSNIGPSTDIIEIFDSSDEGVDSDDDWALAGGSRTKTSALAADSIASASSILVSAPSALPMSVNVSDTTTSDLSLRHEIIASVPTGSLPTPAPALITTPAAAIRSLASPPPTPPPAALAANAGLTFLASHLEAPRSIKLSGSDANLVFGRHLPQSTRSPSAIELPPAPAVKRTTPLAAQKSSAADASQSVVTSASLDCQWVAEADAIISPLSDGEASWFDNVDASPTPSDINWAPEPQAQIVYSPIFVGWRERMGIHLDPDALANSPAAINVDLDSDGDVEKMDIDAPANLRELGRSNAAAHDSRNPIKAAPPYDDPRNDPRVDNTRLLGKNFQVRCAACHKWMRYITLNEHLDGPCTGPTLTSLLATTGSFGFSKPVSSTSAHPQEPVLSSAPQPPSTTTGQIRRVVLTLGGSSLAKKAPSLSPRAAAQAFATDPRVSAVRNDRVQCRVCRKLMFPSRLDEHVTRRCTGSVNQYLIRTPSDGDLVSVSASSSPSPVPPPPPTPTATSTPAPSSTAPPSKLSSKPVMSSVLVAPSTSRDTTSGTFPPDVEASLNADPWVKETFHESVFCRGCSAWIQLGASSGALIRWSGRKGHKVVCPPIVEATNKERTDAKLRELYHLDEIPAIIPDEIKTDPRVRSIEGDQALCDLCGTWMGFPKWAKHHSPGDDVEPNSANRTLRTPPRSRN